MSEDTGKQGDAWKQGSELGNAPEQEERLKQLLEALGLRVRALRVERDLSQGEVAARAGISLPHVGSIERGQTNASVETLVRLASALKVSVAELFFGIPGLIESTGPLDVRDEGAASEIEGETLLSAAVVAQIVHVEPRTIQKWIRDGLLIPSAFIQSSRQQRYAAFRREDIPRVIEVRNRASVRRTKV